MTPSMSPLRSARWAMFPVLIVTLAGADAAQGAAHVSPQAAPVRLVRVHGASALTVVAPHASIGLRVSIPTPPNGATTAKVRVVRDGKLVHNATVGLVISGRTASFAGPITADQVGVYRVAVRVGSRVVGRGQDFKVLPRSVTSGSSQSQIRMMQSALRRHGYVLGKRGAFDARTGRALVAIRKRLGLSRTPTYDRRLAIRLARGQGDFAVKFPGHGRHVEASLQLQLLALIGAGGHVEHIYTTSSGKPSTPTVLGHFAVYRKDFGTNAEGMVDSSYFIRGYAIHGYAQVPSFNASHGCLRVPVPDAANIFRWVSYGTKVDVYQ